MPGIGRTTSYTSNPTFRVGQPGDSGCNSAGRGDHVATDRPTLDTVAQAAGVSRMTVSNAYNRPDQLSAATRERVLAIADHLGYCGPDPAGRSLRRGRTGTIGVLLTESLSYAFTDPGLVAFLRGAADELSGSGHAMLLVPVGAHDDGALVRNAIVDAFVVCSMRDDDPSVRAVRSRRLPFVTAGSPRLSGAPFVGIDNREAGALAAEHLLSLGHRRLGVVALPASMPVEPDARVVRSRLEFAERVAGFLGAATAAGIDPGSIAVADAETNDVDAGSAATRSLLSQPDRPTGVFAVSDVLALGALAAASDLAVDVPAQVSVVGFDDIDEAAHSRPALTTVAQELREQGRDAVRVALALIDARPARSARRTPHLVLRASTAPPPRVVRQAATRGSRTS
jgi:DNA-binding LacI/PurR family transcriptional regulator